MANPEDIFSAQTPPVEDSVDLGLNDLVGEGKKYKDPDQLAKAYANIEAHARRVEADNARIRAERDALDAKPNNPNPNTGQEPSRQPDPANPTPSYEAPNPESVDFRSQIREEFKALSESEKMAANVEATAQKLVDTYGSPLEANRALQQRAQELNVSVDWLRDSAARSPAAFYATMGIAGGSTPAQSRTTPASGDGIRVNDTGNVKNFEYFDKLRRDNPKLYFSATTQREMMNQARTMGSDFYKR